jgi:hypothetical protein
MGAFGKLLTCQVNLFLECSGKNGNHRETSLSMKRSRRMLSNQDGSSCFNSSITRTSQQMHCAKTDFDETELQSYMASKCIRNDSCFQEVTFFFCQDSGHVGAISLDRIKLSA